MDIFKGFPDEESIVNYTLNQAYQDNVTVFASTPPPSVASPSLRGLGRTSSRSYDCLLQSRWTAGSFNLILVLPPVLVHLPWLQSSMVQLEVGSSIPRWAFLAGAGLDDPKGSLPSSALLGCPA